jgi:hypothetical protein
VHDRILENGTAVVEDEPVGKRAGVSENRERGNNYESARECLVPRERRHGPGPHRELSLGYHGLHAT